MGEPAIKETEEVRKKKTGANTIEAAIAERAFREFVRMLDEKTIEQMIGQEPQKKEQEEAEETGAKTNTLPGDMDYHPLLQFIEHPYHQLDYAKLYAHMGNARITVAQAQPDEDSSQQQGSRAQQDGAGMSHAQAASMVERILRSQALQQLPDATEEEKERFRYWRLFSENKVLRRLYESQSGFRVERHYHMRMEGTAKV